jgi:hypothetical protein
MPGKRHVHKYIRTQLRFALVWRCADPECTHFMPPHQEGLMDGRASFCWQCSQQFILDTDALKEDMPRCPLCRMPEIVDLDIDDLIAHRLK